MSKLKRTMSIYWGNLLMIVVCLLNLLLYCKNPYYPKFGWIWVLLLIAYLIYLYWSVTRPYIAINDNNLVFYLSPWKIIRINVDGIKAVKGYRPYPKMLVMSFSLSNERDTLLFEMMGCDDIKISPLGMSETNRGRIIDFLVQNKIQFQNLDEATTTT